MWWDLNCSLVEENHSLSILVVYWGISILVMIYSDNLDIYNRDLGEYSYSRYLLNEYLN